MVINMARNSGCDFDIGWINRTNINLSAIQKQADNLQKLRTFDNEYKAAWLVRAITCIDLTTLSGDDTPSNVNRLCQKAANPLTSDVVSALGFDKDFPIHTAAVCVYPSKVKDVVTALKNNSTLGKIGVASGGFSSGQMPLKARIEEIRYAVEEGATEIDIVIDRSLVLTGKWEQLYDEIKQMRAACGEAHLKTILATGELANLKNIYKASMVAMMAGSDFIKTSTGKEAVNATIPFGIVMCRAIQDYYNKTSHKVGLKPAGGIRTCEEAISWLVLVKEELGNDWCNSKLFRIGASGLLADIERFLYHFAMKKYPAPYDLEMA